ncbi:hypothetical protein [Amycolatopsis sp. CA-230715]|uniref:hypothetical protein n=1 Tax=Amycolatopsis sp. CA-230715 TaxID=2745196 RepID=UPI001C024565|nr:hypothetical protein [Amycolatopsis sp. CA-230715]QWF78691.1 hypothetical protein HUW46_02089 [Amycolatopsis sp. CA-230715]
MTWRVARALDTLLSQLNARAPARSRASDGSIGDAAHATRDSDHNPWYRPGNGPGVVTARDFTHDPAAGLDGHWLADALVRSRDPRIKYVIWNRRIIDSRAQYGAWQWKPYTGTNPHTKHVHLSVMPDGRADDTRAWNLGANPPEDELSKTASEQVNEIYNSLSKTFTQAGVEYGDLMVRLARLFPPVDEKAIAARKGHSAGTLTNATHSVWEGTMFDVLPRVQAIEKAQAEQDKKLDAILTALGGPSTSA